jgi:hypothetical protein
VLFVIIGIIMVLGYFLMQIEKQQDQTNQLLRDQNILIQRISYTQQQQIIDFRVEIWRAKVGQMTSEEIYR